jgi:transaldolase
MKIFLDSGKPSEIEKWIAFVDGITTNPSILRKDNSSIEAVLRSIPQGFPVSIEVGLPYRKAALEAGAIEGVSVKIPLVNPDRSNNLDLIRELTEEGLSINCTALFSLGQVILASKAGARYVSIFGGRVDDEGGCSFDVIQQCVDYLVASDSQAELIVGSIRSVSQVSDALVAGAHIITLPPAILEKMVMHNFSVETARQFQTDWEASLKDK